METTPQPFTNIAVSLSGGGYRATTFHLGALSYLNTLHYKGENMLHRVKVISTISGGTLTGVMYALYAATDRTFDECYKKLYDLLEEDKLVERALHKLSNTSAWRDQTKSKDLINAFSEVYNEFFYEDAHFSVLFDDHKSHLKDVIFGATEFTDGIQFRFQENHHNGRFGNGILNLPDDVAKDFRLGDAAAASSCFPGGFEPLIMSKDFAAGPNSEIAKAWKEKGYPVTGIMDGGVIDNQGIEGVQLAERRHDKTGEHPYIGTYIISDVSGRTMAPYVVPTIEYSSFKDFFTFKSINLIVGLMVAVIIGLLFFVDLHLLTTVLLSCLLTLGMGWIIVFWLGKSFVKKVLQDLLGQDSSSRVLKDFGVILRTPIYILAHLIRLRATSVIKMVSDIFLRRIRTLQLSALFGHSEWKYRIKTNNIYTLYEAGVEKNYEPSPAMLAVAKAANDMGTTLWFTEEQKKDRVLDKLIACGQFTVCLNLIRYIENLQKGSAKENIWDHLDPTTQQDILELDKKMREDFDLFKKDPLRMVAVK
ncbi:MAG: patatin-like phospholipase family protein [Saprospiraceae bacterium]